MRRIVTLFGTLLPEQKEYPRHWIVLDIDPEMGNAKEFGIAGQVAFLPKQILEFREGQAGERSIVRIPEHIAQSKADNTVAKNKRRKR